MNAEARPSVRSGLKYEVVSLYFQSGGFIHKRIDSRTRAQKSGLVIT